MHTSYFESHKEREPSKIITIEEIYNLITKPDIRIQELNGKIRKGEKELKRKLPAFTPSGIFANRSKNGLIKHSGLFIIDLDLKDNDQERINYAYEVCKQNEHTALTFRSPSGGIKILVRVNEPYPSNAEEHETIFLSTVIAWIEDICPNIVIDTSGKDVTRLCYFSYDTGACINNNAIPIEQKAPKGVIDPRKYELSNLLSSNVQKAERLRNALERNLPNYKMTSKEKGKWQGACPRYVLNNSCRCKNDGFVIYDNSGTFSCRGCITKEMDEGTKQKHRAEVNAIAFDEEDELPISEICNSVYNDLPDEDAERILLHFVEACQQDNTVYTEGIGYRKWNKSKWETIEEGEIEECVATISKVCIPIAKERIKHYENEHNELEQEMNTVCRTNKEKDQYKIKLNIISAAHKEQKRNLQAFYSGGKHSKQTAVRKQYSSRHSAPSDMWNKSSGLISFPNGTYDTELMEFRESRKDDYIINIIPFLYDKEAKCPTLIKTLERLIPNKEVREFFQTFMGYTITGTVSQQVMLICHGDGANGKTLIMEALGYALGNEISKSLDPNILMQKYGDDNHPTEIMDLLGTRLVYLDEAPTNGRFDEKKLKRLTGGGQIRARKLYKDAIQFNPSHTFVLLTNHLPDIVGRDSGVWRRILIMPWSVQIPSEEQDTDLSRKLRNEAPGIINWLIEGACKFNLNEKKFNAPTEITHYTENFCKEQDIVGDWLDDSEFVRKGQNEYCRVSDALQSIKLFYQVSNIRLSPPNRKSLKDQLTAKGFKSGKKQDQRVYFGFDINSMREHLLR